MAMPHTIGLGTKKKLTLSQPSVKENSKVKKILAVLAVVMVCLAAASMRATAQDKAQTAAPGSNVSGKWHFILDTPGGDRDIDAEFTVDADGKVSGSWGKSSALGTYKNGSLNLDFSFYSDETS